MLFHTRKIFRLVSGLLLCLCLGGVAQTVNAAKHDGQLSTGLSSMMSEYGFTRSEQEAVQELITTMTRSQLPATPVAHKVQEGIAKGYPESAIVRAASAVAERQLTASRQAQQLVDQQNPENAALMGKTIAEGYAAGVVAEDCQRVVHKLQHLRQDMSGADFEILAQETMLASRDLARRQVKSQTITELVLGLLDEESPAQEMVELRNQLRQNTQPWSVEQTVQQKTLQLRSGKGAAMGAGGASTGQGSSGSGGGQGEAGNGDGKGH